MSLKSEWTYERYRLGELSESERRELEAEPDFRDRMAALDESDRRILEMYPAADMARAIRLRAAEEDSTGDGVVPTDEEAETRRFRPFRSIVPLAAAAALIAAALLVVPRMGTRAVHDDASDVLRIKGLDRPDLPAAPELVLYRNGPAGAELLESGDLAREHDLLQVGYLGGGNWWGAIVSVDGSGVVTRHWPTDTGDSVPLERGGETLLPYAYELDDAPDFEAFALVWSDASFPVADAESLLSGFRSGDPVPDASFLNPAGKTGVIMITIRKAP